MTFFDCLHDMGDPVGASTHVHRSLKKDGTWMIVELAARDKLEDNMHPMGGAFYGASTLLCTPASLFQEVRLALGAQAGEKRLREVSAGTGIASLNFPEVAGGTSLTGTDTANLSVPITLVNWIRWVSA